MTIFDFRLTLSCLELGVLLVNHIEATLATYDLAVRGALLQRCSCFHIIDILFVSEYDASLREIVGAHLYLDLVTGQYLDVVHTHLA